MPRRIYTYPARHGLGHAEHASPRSAPSCSRSACCCCFVNVVCEPAARPARRRESVGRADARMVGRLAAAAVQFRRHSACRKPPSAVGGRGSQEADARSSLDAGMVLDHGRETDRHDAARRRAGRDPAACRSTPMRRSCSRSPPAASSSACCCTRGGWRRRRCSAWRSRTLSWLWPERRLRQRVGAAACLRWRSPYPRPAGRRRPAARRRLVGRAVR